MHPQTRRIAARHGDIMSGDWQKDVWKEPMRDREFKNPENFDG